jgi:hypothetical protein
MIWSIMLIAMESSCMQRLSRLRIRKTGGSCCSPYIELILM